MKTSLLLLAAPALLLGACHKQPQQLPDSNPDPMANQLANHAPIEMPPAIKAEVTMRCKDNSLAHVTFFQGDKQANVHIGDTGAPVHLTAANAGDPLTAEGGWKLTGDEKAIELTQPGKPALTCKA